MWIWAMAGSRRVAKYLQDSISIAFDFILKVLLSDTNFTNPPDLERGDPSLSTREKWNDENAMNMEGMIFFNF